MDIRVPSMRSGRRSEQGLLSRQQRIPYEHRSECEKGDMGLDLERNRDTYYYTFCHEVPKFPQGIKDYPAIQEILGWLELYVIRVLHELGKVRL